MRNTAHQFNSNELVVHRKEIGTNSSLVDEDEDDDKPKRARVFDDEGFEVVKKS